MVKNKSKIILFCVFISYFLYLYFVYLSSATMFFYFEIITEKVEAVDFFLRKTFVGLIALLVIFPTLNLILYFFASKKVLTDKKLVIYIWFNLLIVLIIWWFATDLPFYSC